MGLDMYLNKRTYIGAEYEHRKVTGSINIVADGKPVDIKFNRISSITERVGYWRKANHIHNWFVTNVQNGVDDCVDYYVSEENLLKLLAACKEVKENQSKSTEVLPTKGGFFFGGTEYDEYYMADIDNTIAIIEALIAEKGDAKYFSGDIYYSASW
jgi:hypothetical protein